MKTPVTLLERLRQPDNDGAWLRFVDLYTPMLYGYAIKRGVPVSEVPDLVQDVVVILIQRLPEFTYDPDRSFRRWLNTLLMNKWRDYQRHQVLQPRAQDAQTLPEPLETDPTELLSEAEYRQELVARALRLMEADFETTTWQACRQHSMLGRRAEDVAVELGLSVNAVYLATSRVLRRLREELRGLLD
jgi:RNA polymerase sigma-70 factor (ECF subfamily)